jgi:hypothetical protein
MNDSFKVRLEPLFCFTGYISSFERAYNKERRR